MVVSSPSRKHTFNFSLSLSLSLSFSLYHSSLSFPCVCLSYNSLQQGPGRHCHAGLVHWSHVCHRTSGPHPAHRLLHKEEPRRKIPRYPLNHTPCSQWGLKTSALHPSTLILTPHVAMPVSSLTWRRYVTFLTASMCFTAWCNNSHKKLRFCHICM